MNSKQQEAHEGSVWEAIRTLRSDLLENTQATNANTAAIQAVQNDVGEIKRSTAGLVEMFTAWQGAFKVLGWLGTLAKWVGMIAGGAAAVLGLFAAWKAGFGPAEISPK